MPHDRISMDPKVMMGKPIIRGTRITVELILRMLGKGHSIDTLIDAYPGLTHDDILAAQFFAGDGLANERIVAVE